MSCTLAKMKPIDRILSTSDKHAVKLAAELLSSGEVIALPTDTIYGLACSANNEEAIKRLYKIKERNLEKPVAICVSDYEDFLRWAQADHLPNELISKLLPGAVTIVLRKSSHLNNPYLNPGLEKIGIRIPDFDFIRDICREFKSPIALTSANSSSEKSSLNIQEFKHLWPHISAIFDGGNLSDLDSHRAGSTVVDLSKKNICKIIRPGISADNTLSILKQYNIELECKEN